MSEEKSTFKKMFGGSMGIVMALGVAGMICVAGCGGCMLIMGMSTKAGLTAVESARKAAREAQAEKEAKDVEANVEGVANP